MTLRFSLGAIIFLAAWVEVFEGKMHLQLGRRGQLNVSNSFNFAKRVFRCGGNVSNKVSSCVNHATKLLHNCHHHADWVDCVCFSPVQSLGWFWLMFFDAMPCHQSGFFQVMLKINMLWHGFINWNIPCSCMNMRTKSFHMAVKKRKSFWSIRSWWGWAEH